MMILIFLFVQLNNKLAHGQIEFDIIDGEGFWKAAGADTWIPFKKYDVKTSNKGAASSYNKSISITIPAGVKRGLLLCVSTGWQNGMTQSTPAGDGLKTIVATKYFQRMSGICSNVISIYECEFYEGGTITFTYGDANYDGYATGQFILIA